MASEDDAGIGELDVKWLRLFEQIHETRSVTRSAEALGQSQPTVSIWLGKLRERLGVTFQEVVHPSWI